MNAKQMERMRGGKGFIAALDQSGGSTPKALERYGIPRGTYSDEKDMFDLVHKMRTRVVTNPAFTSEHILGTILFEQAMGRRYTRAIVRIVALSGGYNRDEADERSYV